MKVDRCRRLANMLKNNGRVKDIREEYNIDFIGADGTRRKIESIGLSCDRQVKKKILLMDDLCPNGFFREAILWSQQISMFKKVLDPLASTSNGGSQSDLERRVSSEFTRPLKDAQITEQLLGLGGMMLTRKKSSESKIEFSVQEKNEREKISCEVCLTSNGDVDFEFIDAQTAHWCVDENVCQAPGGQVRAPKVGGRSPTQGSASWRRALNRVERWANTCLLPREPGRVRSSPSYSSMYPGTGYPLWSAAFCVARLLWSAGYQY